VNALGVVRTSGGRTVAVGQPAPDFTLPRQGGGDFHLGDLLGRRAVVLYFYPKDDTPGCTAEACAFRDRYSVFTDADAEVVGVSSDPVASHDRFAQRHNLPFPLLSDRGGAVRRLYGVAPALGGLLPGRATFVIDRQGVVREVFSSLLAARRHVEVARAALAAAPPPGG